MADKKGLMVIIGINSRQGSSIARHFISKPHLQLRGLTTKLSTISSQEWLEQGVEMIQVETYQDRTAIEKACHGAIAIFAVTDFYRHLHEHSTLSLADVWKKSPEEVASQRELAEGKVIIAAVAAIKGLKLFVLSSLSPAYGETEEARGLQQFHSKAKIVQYMDLNFPELGMKTSLLKPALYMEDWTRFLRRNPDGRFTFGTTLPASFRLPWTNVSKDMGTLFQLCMCIAPRLNAAAISDIVSGAQICRLVTEVTGLPCDYEQYSEKELEKMLGTKGHIMVDMLNHIVQRQYYEDPGIQLSYHIIKGRSDAHHFHLTSFREYMKAELPRYLDEELAKEETLNSSDGLETSGKSGAEY